VDLAELVIPGAGAACQFGDRRPAVACGGGFPFGGAFAGGTGLQAGERGSACACFLEALCLGLP
jgi:hypothetical protein